MLEAMAERLGIAAQVKFLGYKSAAQVRDLLTETDVFVMSSFAEGVPVVLMEGPWANRCSGHCDAYRGGSGTG